MISLCFDEEQGAGRGQTGSPPDLENSKWVEEQGAGRGRSVATCKCKNLAQGIVSPTKVCNKMAFLNKMKKEAEHFFAHLLFPDCQGETDVELRWKENRGSFFFALTFLH